MKKEKKIKFFLGSSYVLIILTFLWVFFDNFSLSEISSYQFIKNNSEYFISLKNKNFFLTSVVFFIFTITWVLLLGFGSPILLLSGFIFGKWFGSIYAILSLSIGAALLYSFANYFLKDFIEEKFSKKFSNLNHKFKKNEFLFFLIYRFVGGIPFFISNILPTIFNVKLKNFFFGSIIGMFPQVFVGVSLGSGLNEIIQKNVEAPSLIQLLFSSEIYIPVAAFVFLIVIGLIVKKYFYSN
ncbi:MAG: TVP38/TMEM64 family protein [Candidatus Pelagibacter sp.]